MSSTKKEYLEQIKEKEDKPEIARQAELDELVHKRYPNGFKSMTNTITKIMEMKNQTKETQIYKNIDNRPTIGYISTNDLVEL